MDINTTSWKLEPEIVCTTYREAVAEMRFKRCMISIVRRVRITLFEIWPSKQALQAFTKMIALRFER